jgi:hypothetical protein
MYARYHRIALRLAERARILREQVEASGSDAEMDRYEDFILEAELQALTYEAFAQHFLQDRWSSGHMFERWNGGDLEQTGENVFPGIVPWVGIRADRPAGELSHEVQLYHNLSVAFVAGAIHGIEGVARERDLMHLLFTTGDPMSSPLIEGENARPVQYRHASDANAENRIDAVGDERFVDGRTGNFGAMYGSHTGDHEFSVARQFDEMLTCSSAGWAEVVRAFGQTEAGYGAYHAPLSDDAPDFAIIDQERCWDMWATNESMWMGFRGATNRSLATFAALLLESAGAQQNLLPSTEMVSLGWYIWRRKLVDPHGIDVAQGSMGELWGIQPGNAFDLPNYVEPVNLSDLPETDVRGVDRQALFGAFSRAHSDHWCEARVDTIERVRRPASRTSTTRAQHACQYVASLAYEGTHPGYEGPMQTIVEVDDQPVRSMCRIRGVEGETVERELPEDPHYIAPGYYSVYDALPARAIPEWLDRADERAPPAFGDDALANWCARVPVLRMMREPDLLNDHIVAQVTEDDEDVVLNGFDLGDDPGLVTVFDPIEEQFYGLDIVAWTDRQIVARMPETMSRELDHEFHVYLSTGNGRTSVGLFTIRVIEEPELLFAEVDVGGRTPCGVEPLEIDVFDLAASLPRDSITAPIDPDFMRELRDEYAQTAAALEPYFSSEADCIRQRGEEHGAIVQAWLASREPPADPESDIYRPCCTPYAWPFRETMAHPDHAGGMTGNLYLAYAEELDDIRADMAHTIRVLDFWIAVLEDDSVNWTANTNVVDSIAARDAAGTAGDNDRARALDAAARSQLRWDPELTNEDWLEAYFIDAATHPERGQLPRRGAHLAAWLTYGGSIALDAEVTHNRILESLEGLPAWAQVEHTIYHHIRPSWAPGPLGERTGGWASRLSQYGLRMRQMTEGPTTRHRGDLRWPDEQARRAAADPDYQPAGGFRARESTEIATSSESPTSEAPPGFGPREIEPREPIMPDFNAGPADRGRYELQPPGTMTGSDPASGQDSGVRPTKPGMSGSDPDDEN